MPNLSAFAIYTVIAVCEIAGCFAFWAWLRLGKSVLWTIRVSWPWSFLLIF